MFIIFGATGFIGLYTAEHFVKKGYRIIGTGRNKQTARLLERIGVEFIELDVTKKEDFRKLPTQDVDGVIVLTGLLPANAKVNLDVDENAADYFSVNVIGTINILEYCRKNGIKKVIGNTSYSDVSGAWGKKYPITEDEPRDFKLSGDHAVYVISRSAANDVMEYYNQQHGMQCAWFRFPPVYGVGPHSTIYVNGVAKKSGYATFIDNAKEGKPIEVWGNPHLKRDIIYVKDVAQAYEKAINSDKTYGLYNMTAHVQIDLLEQAEIIVEVFGGEKRSDIILKPEKKNATPSYLYSIDKARRDFDFKPQFTDFRDMMLDYKNEMESGRWELLIESRKKDS